MTADPLDGKPAFEVRMPNGHVYKVFANGYTEGFAEDRDYIIFNGITALTRAAYINGMKDGADIVATAAQSAADELGRADLDSLYDAMADFEAKAS